MSEYLLGDEIKRLLDSRELYIRPLLDERQIYRVQLALEELLCNLLLPNLQGKELHVELALSYSGKDGKLTLSAQYSGVPIPLETAAKNELSMTMLTAICREMHWEKNIIICDFE